MAGAPTARAFVSSIDYATVTPLMLGSTRFDANFACEASVGLIAPATGHATLEVTSDDGGRLYVDGVLVADNGDEIHGDISASGTVDMVAGNVYRVRATYWNWNQGATWKVRWTPPGARTLSVLASNYNTPPQPPLMPPPAPPPEWPPEAPEPPHAPHPKPPPPRPPAPPPPPYTMDTVTTNFPITRYYAYRGGPVPELFRRFDWMYHFDVNWKNVDNPTSVWATPDCCASCYRCDLLHSDLNNRNVPREGTRILVIAGEDNRLSRHLDVVRRLLPWFRRIFFMAMDASIPGVYAMPIGLTENYVLEQGPATALRVIYNQNPIKEGQEVIAAFGAFWPQINGMTSRRQASEFCGRHPSEAWLRCGTIEKHQWWEALSKAKFILSPEGNGIQSSKWLEALLAGTIPIEQGKSIAAFQGLRDAGWPFVLVDDWEEVASAANRDRWWRELSPIVAHLRAHGSMTVNGIMQYMTANLLKPPHVNSTLQDDWQ